MPKEMKGKFKQEIILWPHGGEWMVGRQVTVLDVFQEDGIDMAFCEYNSAAMQPYQKNRVPLVFIDLEEEDSTETPDPTQLIDDLEEVAGNAPMEPAKKVAETVAPKPPPSPPKHNPKSKTDTAKGVMAGHLKKKR